MYAPAPSGSPTCYGPRQLIKHNRQGFIGWFIRLALEDKTIQIYGDGAQLRDFVHVDDAADAFLRAGADDTCNGEVFNVGGSEPISHRDLTSLLIAAAGSGRVEYIEWPAEKKAIDIGSFYADSSEVPYVHGMDADNHAARGSRVDTRVLPRELRTICRRGRPAGNRVSRFRIPFGSPAPREDGPAVRSAIERVVHSGWYVLGPEVSAFEAEFAAACGAEHAVGVGTGTDAIALILRGLGIGAGDEVITTPLSAAYTALAVMMAGARPVFADIDPARHTLAPAAVERAITARTRAILPVHLYGQAADMDALMPIAARHGLAVVEDACQAHLATAAGRPVGTIGVAGAFSFYPTKNLGALGDGGAIVTNDAALASKLRRLRNGGQTDRYHHAEPGINSRLDELQAAVLRVRLSFLSEWTARRRSLAAVYRTALSGTRIQVPVECDPGHVYHLFVIRTQQRAALQQHLAAGGVETLVHYPVPIPRQPALASQLPTDCPEGNRACDEVLSLPMHPGLDAADVETVAACVRSFNED